MSKLTRFAGGAKLVMIEHAPKIAMGGGTICFGLTIYSAAKAAVRFQDDLKVHRERMAKLDDIDRRQKEAAKNALPLPHDIADVDVRTFRRSVWLETGKKAVIRFGPTVIIGGLSLACFFTGFGILNKRYLGAMATVATLVKERTLLEGNILEEFGPEKLAELKGLAKKTEKSSHIDDSGQEVVDTEDGYEGTGQPSVFAKWFDEENPNWTKDPESNRLFLQGIQNRLNDRLQRKGHLFLNDVLVALGMKPTQAGQMFGWKIYKDPEEAKKNGATGYIDFGLFNVDSTPKRNFINGYERSILIEFNCDKLPILGKVGYEEC